MTPNANESAAGRMPAPPDTAQAFCRLGNDCWSRGQLDQAAANFRRALDMDPDYAEAHTNLGSTLCREGNHDEAVRCHLRALAIRPDYAAAHNNLGNALKQRGDLERAVTSYRRALEIDPAYAVACRNLGIALAEQGRLQEAVASYRRALTIAPAYAAAHHSLGNALGKQGKYEEAAASFRQVIKINPGNAAAYMRLGHALARQGQFEEAAATFRHALRINPGDVVAHHHLGAALEQQGKLQEAVANYMRAVQLQPGDTTAYGKLGNALSQQGKLAEALDWYASGLKVDPSDLSLMLASALALPVIPDSKEQILQARSRMDRELDRLLDAPLPAGEPTGTGPIVPQFFLAYHGLDDHSLQSKIAALHAKVYPSLQYTAAHCQQPIPGDMGDRRIRVGFISTYFFDHTVGKLMRGLVTQLDRDLFERILVTFPGPADRWRRAMEAGTDASVVLPVNLKAAREQIAEQKLDVLFYADIGMDPFTYHLAFSRLAPVQCVTWGHPVTTGVPAIDYFISQQDLETEHGPAGYTEELVPLKNLPTYYDKPSIPQPRKSKAELGLSPTRNTYLCPQSLFKLHPDFDHLLGAILRRDHDGDVVLIQAKCPRWQRLLIERFRRTIPSVVARIRFLPRVSSLDFLQLVAAADVVLDPIHFGGGNTVYEAMAVGTPIVTWPGKFMRGRVSAACYRQMGVSDCVASSAEEYVELAVKFGTDRQANRDVRTSILAANSVLYENADAVRELERFFVQAVHEAKMRSQES